jgi:hypothetical protein
VKLPLNIHHLQKKFDVTFKIIKFNIKKKAQNLPTISDVLQSFDNILDGVKRSEQVEISSKKKIPVSHSHANNISPIFKSTQKLNSSATRLSSADLNPGDWTLFRNQV